MINNPYVEVFLCPQEGIRVTSLASQEKGAEKVQVILADMIAIGIFALDSSQSRRCREQDSYLMLGDDPPESAGVGRTNRFALV